MSPRSKPIPLPPTSATLPSRKLLSTSKKTAFFFPAKRAHLAPLARRAKIFRATPHALAAAIPAPVSSAPSAEAAGDAIADPVVMAVAMDATIRATTIAAAAKTAAPNRAAAAVLPTLARWKIAAAAKGVRVSTAAAAPARALNAARAVVVNIVATAAIPVHRAVRN